MSTAPAEEQPSGAPWTALVLVAVLVGVLLATCGLPGGDDPPPPVAADPARVAEPAIAELLGQRSRALGAADRDAWLATVGEGPTYRERQGWTFDNLVQLPRAVARYELVAGSARSDQDEVVADVRRVLQVSGWDVVPVTTVAEYRFRLTAGVGGTSSYRVVADTEAAAPWDLAPVRVVVRDGALLVTDAADERADALAEDVDRAIDQVAAQVPLPWNGRAMVYALSAIDVLQAVEGLPVDDPEQLDGVAFAVPAGPEDRTLAAVRVVLHPRLLDTGSGSPARGRLLRHELTHVALGDRDDRVPTWLSEGVAELVSVRGMPMNERVISRAAIDAARAGVTELPTADDFRGARSGASYGIAWWACEYVAETWGDDRLWSLLASYAAAPDEEGDAVLQRVLGVDDGELAARAGARIVSVFG
ncbi:MAG TPA: hypothetical protein VGE77_06945 [Nocardioides sp.]